MKLIDINNENINIMLKKHDEYGGNKINDSLSKLFTCMCNESSEYEIQIKVAALNQIYSTSIQFIKPVVENICNQNLVQHREYTQKQYADLVDKIAHNKWTSKISNKEHKKNYLSFASKYVHFLSQYQIPIYDSYIWIVIIGYLKQKKGNQLYSFSTPKTYKEFYKVFCEFKNAFLLLNDKSIYEIDKFLWQYGKDMIEIITKTENKTLDQAKSELKKQLMDYT